MLSSKVPSQDKDYPANLVVDAVLRLKVYRHVPFYWVFRPSCLEKVLIPNTQMTGPLNTTMPL